MIYSLKTNKFINLLYCQELQHIHRTTSYYISDLNMNYRVVIVATIDPS